MLMEEMNMKIDMNKVAFIDYAAFAAMSDEVVSKDGIYRIENGCRGEVEDVVCLGELGSELLVDSVEEFLQKNGIVEQELVDYFSEFYSISIEEDRVELCVEEDLSYVFVNVKKGGG